MFRPDTSLDLPIGSDLLAEIGVDRHTVREIAEHDRAMRCPDRSAIYPAYGFASLAPESPFEQALQDATLAEPRGPASSFPPAD